jgi:serine/threonine-protein kinase
MTPLAVGELMARSGHYNVPADYFHDRAPAYANGQTLPPSSGVGRSSRSVGVMLGVAAGLVLGAVLVLVYAFREPSSKGASLPSATAPQSGATVLAPGQSTPPIAPKKRTVAIVVTPNDAHVTLANGTPASLERGIARIELSPNEPMTISASRAGYVPGQLTLGDTSGELERFDLVPVSVKPGTKPGTHPDKPPVVPVAPQPPPVVTVAPTVAPHTAPKKPERPAHCASIPRDDDSLRAYPECR